MKNMIKKCSFLVLIMGSCNPVNAFNLNDFKNLSSPVLGAMAVGAAAVAGGIGYLFRGRNYAADKIRLLEKQAIQTKEHNIQKAEILLHKINVEHEDELRHAGKTSLTKDMFNKAASRFAHETPFVHTKYSKELSADSKELNVVQPFIKTSDQEKAEEMAKQLKLLLETHNAIFKDVLAAEYKAQQEATLVEHKINIKKEKLVFFQETNKAVRALEQKAKMGLEEVVTISKKVIQNIENVAYEMRQQHIRDVRAILNTIQIEFDSNGLHAMSGKLEKLDNSIKQLSKKQEISLDVQYTIESTQKKLMSQHAQLTQQVKNQGVATEKDIAKFNALLAKMVVLLSNMETRNKYNPQPYTSNLYPPSAPPADAFN